MSCSSAPPLILSIFSTFAVGGPQVRFTKLAAHFAGRFRHAIVAMDGDCTCRERLDPKLDVVYPAIPFHKGRTASNVFSFRKALRELSPDVMVTSNWGSIEWSIANALPITRHIHIEDGFGPEEHDSQIRRRVWMRYAFLHRCTVVVPSMTLRRIATEKWGLPETHVHYIPNGVDCARFAHRADGIHWPGTGTIIGTVAALRPEKNLSRLLLAIKSVADRHAVRLVIVGDGPDLPKLQRLAGDLGLADRVFFVGHSADPEAYYASFDIFALSSDTEQMPLSVIEAMAAGLPIAATRVGDVPGMVSDENYRFVTRRDERSLAEALQALVFDRALRQRLGAANQAKAFSFYDEREMFLAYSRLLVASAQASDQIKIASCREGLSPNA
jgi:glycosyltransferase involved in cell wall biosynthesis